MAKSTPTPVPAPAAGPPLIIILLPVLAMVALIPFLMYSAWVWTAGVTRNKLPVLKEKAIVLIIAHPDDEAMFFSPTITGLMRPELGNHLKILCLSSGNAAGLGHIRKKEIMESGVHLGLRFKSDVLVLDVDSFPDSMTAEWPTDIMRVVLDSMFLSKNQPKYSSPSMKKRKKKGNPEVEQILGDPPPETTIDAVITFDAGGVSSHPNHISVHNGVVEWAKGLIKNHAGWDPPVQVYSLVSRNIVRKYLGALDSTLTMFNGFIASKGGKKKGEWPEAMVFVSGPEEYAMGRRAMTKAHKSQMVWFRWGWITIGRYMYINDLVKEKLVK